MAFEVKFDGVRAVGYASPGGGLALYSRQDLAALIGPGLLGRPGASRSSTVRLASAGGDVRFGLGFVQVPARPVRHPGALDDQVLAMIDEQLQRA